MLIFALTGVEFGAPMPRIEPPEFIVPALLKMYSTPELFFTKDPRVPEQQKDLLISFTLPPELPKNWVRTWLGMAAIKRPIPTPNSTVPMSSTRICQRENIGRNLLISNDWDQTGGRPELPSEAVLDHNCGAGDQSA